MHGHRYAIEITLAGNIITHEGDSSNGMAMDFSEIQSLARQHLVDNWDHAFLAHADDTLVIEFLKTLPGHKTFILGCVPTAENLAKYAFDILDRVYHHHYGNNLRLARVRLFETPNCWADAVRQEFLNTGG